VFDDKFIDEMAERVFAKLKLRIVELTGARPQAAPEVSYMTLLQASELLNTSYEGIRWMIRNGQIPVIKRSPRRYVVDRRDVIAYLEKNKTTMGESLPRA